MTLRPHLVLGAFVLAPVTLHAQVSVTTIVDLALRNSPKVKMAGDDYAKARASLEESRDVYVPAISVGAGLGDSYGYSPYPPTLFTFEAHSLVYSAGQIHYIRSARHGLDAATAALTDAREAVAEDAVTTFAQFDRDTQREAATRQQAADQDRLLAIVRDRFDAGLETTLDVRRAELAQAQLATSILHAEDETANDRAHLATLTNLPTQILTAGLFPAFDLETETTPAQNKGVAAAFAQAAAKQELAIGDSKFRYRPQVSFAAEYERYATFASSFKNLPNYQDFGANLELYGVQVNIPLFDKVRSAKSRESAADASRALHDAEGIRANAQEGQAKLTRSLVELRARARETTLAQQVSSLELEAVTAQINAAATGTGPQLTPKDVQNARIAERAKYLDVLDATYQLRLAQIDLLRSSGRLEDWVRGAPVTSVAPVSQ